MDAAGIRRSRTARVLLHRRERRQEPAALHPGTRAAAAPTIRRRRRGDARRDRVARSPRRAGRQVAPTDRRGSGRSHHHRSALTRRRAQRVPGPRRGRAGSGLDWQSSALHRLRIPPAHARGGLACRPPRPRRGALPDRSRRRERATVVAIQSLHEQAQRFVVGALLKETFQQYVVVVEERRRRPRIARSLGLALLGILLILYVDFKSIAADAAGRGDDPVRPDRRASWRSGSSAKAISIGSLVGLGHRAWHRGPKRHHARQSLPASSRRRRRAVWFAARDSRGAGTPACRSRRPP